MAEKPVAVKPIVLSKPAEVNGVLRPAGWTANVSFEDYERLSAEGALELPVPEGPAEAVTPATEAEPLNLAGEEENE